VPAGPSQGWIGRGSDVTHSHFHQRYRYGRAGGTGGWRRLRAFVSHSSQGLDKWEISLSGDIVVSINQGLDDAAAGIIVPLTTRWRRCATFLAGEAFDQAAELAQALLGCRRSAVPPPRLPSPGACGLLL
jgi:hypothetical protein